MGWVTLNKQGDFSYPVDHALQYERGYAPVSSATRLNSHQLAHVVSHVTALIETIPHRLNLAKLKRLCLDLGELIGTSGFPNEALGQMRGQFHDQLKQNFGDKYSFLMPLVRLCDKNDAVGATVNRDFWTRLYQLGNGSSNEIMRAAQAVIKDHLDDVVHVIDETLQQQVKYKVARALTSVRDWGRGTPLSCASENSGSDNGSRASTPALLAKV